MASSLRIPARWHARCGPDARETRAKQARRRASTLPASRPLQAAKRARCVIAQAKKRGFSEQLLDYVEAGPKMRKWYGQADDMEEDDMYGDYEVEFDDEEEEADDRPIVMVTDAESEMGQILVLQLILQRQRVRVLVNDVNAAKLGFGPYVEPFEGDCGNDFALADALKGVKVIICCGQVGKLPAVASQVRGIEHLVLLSATGTTTEAPEEGFGFFGGFSAMAAERKTLRSKKREFRLASGKVPYTIVRVGKFDSKAEGRGLSFQQGDTTTGTISREDAAKVCIQAALGLRPEKALAFEVVADGPAGAASLSPEKIDEALRALKEVWSKQLS